ncbi:MAG: class I SAM-dependent RNA methyltransferase [Bacillota bacterium]
MKNSRPADRQLQRDKTYKTGKILQKSNKPIEKEEEKPSFSAKLLNQANIERKTGKFDCTTEIEPLADFPYEKELLLKNRVFREFWKENNLPLSPENIVPSPKPRNYRTTTKRRVIKIKGRFFLVFSEEARGLSQETFTPSLLEPEEHSRIYRYLVERINEPTYSIIGHNLNFLIIRGSYSEFSVIFNVHSLTGAVVNKIKAVSAELKNSGVNVISAFIYLDPTRSDYYLENIRPVDQVNFKKIFGPDKLFVRFHDKKYSFYPTSFSQVNESMVPVMLDNAKQMLLPADENRFIDLYCGYGLFSHFLADYFTETLGIEAEGSSIKSAIENSQFISHKGKIRFLAKRITSESLEDILPDNDLTGEVYLLDPPRQGTEKGVIKTIALREPAKLLHIFCNVDRIARETAEWKKNGYKIQKVLPLDMFPGTPNLEVMILLVPYTH